MQMKTAMVVLCLALLLLASCAPKPKVTPVTKPAAPAMADVGESVAQVSQLDKELNTGDLDQLDQDLASIDKIDFG